MSVFLSLMRAHRLMERLIDRLERSQRYDTRMSEREARDTLLVLLPALERHEKIEDLVFGDAVSEQVALQHRKLDMLRTEIADFIQNTDERDHARFSVLLPSLVSLLRRHFETEERTLWPSYRAKGRCFERSTERAARRQIKDLEKEIDWSWRSLADLSH